MKRCRQISLFLALFIGFGLFSTTVFAQQFNGRLEWLHKIELRSLENAVIEKVLIRIGQQVKKGSLLISLEKREFEAQVARRQATLDQVTLEHADAQDDLDRAMELYDRGLIAEEELKENKIRHAKTAAAVESAKADLKLAQIALERCEIRSPINGIIAEKNAWEGTVVYKTLQQKPLVSVAPYGRMLARVLVNSTILQRYRPGQPARVNIDGKLFKGRVYSLGMEAVRIDPEGAVYELDILFNYPPSIVLRPSQTVKVMIP